MTRASRQTRRANAADDISMAPQRLLVVVCEDQRPIGFTVARTCEALGIRVEVMSGCSRLFELLHYMQPSAVIADLDLSEQDGFDVMKIVAGYNRDLPLLMVTADPILLGAVDAIEELWRLSNVWRLEEEPTGATLVEFLERSGVLSPSPGAEARYAVPPPLMPMPVLLEAMAAE